MKLKVWENVIVSWVNAMSLSKIEGIFELKNGNFFLNILDRLHYKGDESFKDVFYSPEDIHPYVIAFIKDIYPDYEIPCRFNSEEDITLIGSLLLLWFCLKTKDKELLKPLYSLGDSAQCCIQAFLEKLLYIPSSSLTKDLIFTAILSIDETYYKDTIICASPSSPCIQSGRQDVIMSPAFDKSKEELRVLKRDVDLLRSENSFLLGELEQFKSDGDKMANEIETKNKDILRLENEVFVLSGEANTSRKEKRRSGGFFREKKLKNEVEELEKLTITLKQEVNSVTDSRNQLRKKVGNLEKDNIFWKEKVAETEDRCSFLEMQLSQTETVISQLQQTVVEQREFLSETHFNGNVSVGNDASFLSEDVGSPSVSENLVSVIEVKYNELEASYQSLLAEFNKSKLILQDKDKRIYSLMAEINTNSHELNILKEELTLNKEHLAAKELTNRELDLEITHLKENVDKLENEKVSCMSDMENLNLSLSKLNNENLDLAKHLDTLNSLINEKNTTLIFKDQEIDVLNNTLFEKDDILKRADTEMVELKNNILNKSCEIDSLKLKVEELSEDNTKTKDILSEETFLKENIQNENTKLKETIFTLEGKTSNLSNDIKSLKLAITTLEEEKKMCLLNTKLLKEECDSKNEALESKSNIIAEHESKIASLDSEINEFKLSVETMTHENLELSNRSLNLDNLNQDLKAKCISVTKDMKMYKNQVNELQKEIHASLEEKSSLLSHVEEFDKNVQQIKAFESEISTLNEVINLDKMQLRKNAEEKSKMNEELSFKQREIEGLTLQLIDNKKIQETETIKYQDLVEKFDELKNLNETHLKELVSQRKRVTELESENLEHVYEISHLREAKEKFEVKMKDQFDSLMNDVESLKNLKIEMEKEKLKLLDEKARLEKCMEELEDKISQKEAMEIEIQKLNKTTEEHVINLKQLSEENTLLSAEVSTKEGMIDELKQLVDEQKLLIHNLESQMESTVKEKESLDDEIIAIKKMKEELGEENASLLQSKTDLENVALSKAEEVKDEIHKLNKTIEEHMDTMNQLNAENKLLSDEISMKIRTIDELNQLVEDQKSNISHVEFQMENTIKEKDSLDSEITVIKTKKVKLEEENATLLQSKADLEKTLNSISHELVLVNTETDKLKASLSKYELEINHLNQEKSSLSVIENSLNDKLQLLTTEIEEKTKLLEHSNCKITDLCHQLENEKAVVSDLLSENKCTLDKNQLLVSVNEEMKQNLQDKSIFLEELKAKLSSMEQSVDWNNSELNKLETEKKSLEDEVKNFASKTSTLMSEINGLSEELSTKTSANKCLMEELSLLRDQLAKANTKNKELSDRVETLNDLIMQYCITIQDNTSYVSELKNKMASLKESLATKDVELLELKQEKKSISVKYEESVKCNENITSKLSSLIDAMDEKKTKILDLKRVITELECGKKDLSNERDHLSKLVNTYSGEIKDLNKEFSLTKEALVRTQNDLKSLHNEITDKNNQISVLNDNISGLKYGLVENSKLLKQILNETRFFGEVTMTIHEDVNDSLLRINSSSYVDDGEDEIEFPKEESPFDPAFVKWRDLQCEIIKALKNQLDCVYSAAKEKDMLCNDLNLKINDLILEKRQESLESDNYRSEAVKLKQQIDELTESTKKLLSEKDETISALKEELSFLSDSEAKDAIELRHKIEHLIEFNAELEFKLNQAQLERDFFKEESELLVSLKNDIKEKDAMMLKLEQDIEMLEHEKNILDKRVVFLTKDAEDVKSLKIELSDIKHKFANMDNGEQCGDIEHLLTDEEKLTRIKPEFLKNDLDPEDRRLSITKSLQGVDKPKKEIGQIIYRKPGPPTPSKNGTRLSLSDANCLPSTSGLREQNNIDNKEEKETPQTHTKIKSLFTAKPPKQTSQEGAVKKKSGFFRRKKERENISPT